ncbi:unnamed protein product [Allacma fusca]|uniref:UDP-glycosyltransferase n=1 Tax=Allacma fusca TaxID=39272 RepID=A0A8J2LF82_9HEXA|nr:unnamed protein product [Allacma fusca]
MVSLSCMCPAKINLFTLSQSHSILNFPGSFLVSFSALSANAAKILFYMGPASHSHRVAVEPLVDALAEKGHEIKIFSMVKPDKPNPKVKEVCPESLRQAHGTVTDDVSKASVLSRLENRNFDKWLEGTATFDFYVNTLERMIRNGDFAHWIKTEKVDLIISDNPSGQIAYGVAHEMKAKIIAFVNPAAPNPGDFNTFGLPEESSWLPDWYSASRYWFLPYHFSSAYNSISWYFSHNWYLLPKIDALLKELYGKELPLTQQLMKKVDLVFLNEHFSSGFPKALPPYAIPVGGMHVKKSNGTLPENIENFLKTKDRFVYISFGSIIKISNLPTEKQRILSDSADSFEEINFLIKWDGAIPADLPKNIFATKWFPQQDVLAHPKCYVARTAEYHGIGIHLELADITEETLTKAFSDLLNNERYGRNVKELSKRSKDRPMTPVETAVWWTEYVLRHDTSHLKSPVKEVFPEALRQAHATVADDVSKTSVLTRLEKRNFDVWLDGSVMLDFYVNTIEGMLRDEEFTNWIKTEKADLIIYDNPSGQFVYGVAHEMKAKVIAFVNPAAPIPGDFITFGLPEESSWLPDWYSASRYWFLPYHFSCAYNSIAWYFSHNWYLLPKIDAMLKDFYERDIPSTQELMKKVDLVFLNEHFTSGFPKALPPYAIPVGGMHVKKSNGTLPENIENFLKTKDRFVYISFGSVIKVSNLPPKKQRILTDSVASFEEINFLIKWDGVIPEDLPKNVFAAKWFPQQDVLAHPKCKGFVTQGGSISYQQAVFHGVPLIVVPVWGDQGYVARTAEYHGIGIHLELADITEETLKKALSDLLNNERYGRNVKELSKRSKDRPMTPVETAVWWTEYVLRHDTNHLKSPGIQQEWWQRRLLDFWGVVFSVILLSTYLVYKSCKILYIRCFVFSVKVKKS